jgi:hypothetical protein
MHPCLLTAVRRRLTLPSRGRFPAYGLQAPLMLNVRRLKVSLKRASLLASAVALALGLAAAMPARSVEPPAPFESVVANGQTIVATLPVRVRLQVIETTSKPRLTQPGEAFTFAAGASLLLTERHSSYRVTAQLEPRAGVHVIATIDTRSIGGTLSRTQCFIRAIR